MARLMITVAAVCIMLKLAAGRVVDNRSDLDEQSINELLQRSDPYENDIFYESRPAPSAPRRRPQPTSPTAHLLESFSRPRYVDASEFRTIPALPPAFDINRQLTLLSASKSYRRPTPVFVEEPTPIDYENIEFSVNPAPLFRGDFPAEDVEYYQETPEDSTTIIAESQLGEALDKGPVYSTSVSVSSSVSYSNNTSSTSKDETTASPETLNTPSTTSTTTSKPSTSTTTVESATDPQSPSVEEGPRAARLLRYEQEQDYPEYGVLSPLSHILGGFGGEFGPFGGDQATDGFIRGFRPLGF